MMRGIRFLIALFVCSIAFVLPYRLRLAWFSVTAAWVHLPFRLFGWTARFVMKQTGVDTFYGR